MKQVIFAAAHSTNSLEALAREIKRELEGHIINLRPSPVDLQSMSLTDWTKHAAVKAEVVVYLSEVSSDSTNQSTGDDELLVLSHRGLSRLPGHAQIVIVVPEVGDRPPADSELSSYRMFTLSDRDSKAALFCLLAHGPIVRPAVNEGTTALVKLIFAMVGTVVAAADNTRDLLIANLGDRPTQVIYSALALGIAFLLITALVGLMRIAIKSLPSIVSDTLRSWWHPFKAKIKSLPLPAWLISTKTLKIGSVLLASTLLWVFSVITAPDTNGIVDKHQSEWIRRLDRSWTETGGIREHVDEGIPQVWMSAQAISALRCSCGIWKDDNDRTAQTLRFFERARIRSLEWKKPDGQAVFKQKFPDLYPNNPNQPVAAAFNSYEMFFNYLSRARRLPPLEEKRRIQLEALAPEFLAIVDRPNEGWGYYEQWKWGVTEVAGWAGVAYAACIRSRSSVVTDDEYNEQKARLKAICSLLRTRQIVNLGGFSPIPDTSEVSFARTYSTTMALWALSEALAPDVGVFTPDEIAPVEDTIRDGIRWLANSATDEGWKVNPLNLANEELSLGLMAHTLFAIGRSPVRIDGNSKNRLLKLRRHFLATSSTWVKRPAEANVRIHDGDRYLYPTEYAIEGSTLLWYPWCVALLRQFETDSNLTQSERSKAKSILETLKANAGVYDRFVSTHYNYVAAEALIGFNWPAAFCNQK